MKKQENYLAHKVKKKRNKMEFRFRNLWRSKPKIVFTAGFALLGAAFVFSTRASTITSSFEAESGSLAGTAGIYNDAGASSGQFIRFGPASGEVEPDYFVSIDGNDSNPGTASEPFETIDKAISVVSPGEAVLVKSGTYTGDFEIDVSGSSGSPITFMGEPGTKLVTDKSQNNASVWIRADYVTLRGFDVEGNIHVQGHFNIVEENYVHDSWEKVGIFFSAEERNSADCTNNIARSNTIERAVGQGLYLEGRDHQLLNNDVSRTQDTAPDGSNQTDADGMRFFGSGHLVKGNYIHDIWQTDMEGAPHIDIMQTFQEAHDIVFDGNVMHNPNPSGSNRILMLERQAGEGPVSDLTWVNNIFIFSDDSSSHMNFNRKSGQPEIVNMNVVNNVFYTPNGQVEKAASFNNITNAVFKNNLVINTGLDGRTYLDPSDGTTTDGFGNNAVFNTVGSPGGSPYPGDLWEVNPQVVDINGSTIDELDFRLNPGSPLIDAGVSISYTDHDFDGNSRPHGSGWDIGAFEFN